MSTKGAVIDKNDSNIHPVEGEEIFCPAYHEGKCTGCRGTCPSLHSER